MRLSFGVPSGEPLRFVSNVEADGALELSFIFLTKSRAPTFFLCPFYARAGQPRPNGSKRTTTLVFGLIP
jgi:hypothetical protein